MKVDYIKLKNFRGYRKETLITFDNLTVFVGKNDVGKSTIFEALDIFFNDGGGAIKIDANDLSIPTSTDNEIEITVCFSGYEEVIIDEKHKTTLDKEYMLNSAGRLEIKKRYKVSDSNKIGKASVFIRAIHPTNPDCADLLLKKNSELRNIIKTKGISCKDQSVNSVMREAIWNYYSDSLNLEEVEIDASKEGAKEIWEKLKNYMPLYFLFKSDRENKEDDSEIQDPLKASTQEILRDVGVQGLLSEVAEKVLSNLKEVAEKTLGKLREIDPQLAKGISPAIPNASQLKWQDVFRSVSICDDNGIVIDKRGSGVRRLILLSFFRAKAECKGGDNAHNGIIYAIEEPETSLHPNFQRILIETFKELAVRQNGSMQVMFTTHSPVVVKELSLEKVRLIEINEENERVVHTVNDGILLYPSLNEINYLAYGEACEEYHDELYGCLSAKGWIDDYTKGRKIRDYYNEKKQQRVKCDLTTYIRHQIHHPENEKNKRYTPEELRQSISDMRDYIKMRRCE